MASLGLMSMDGRGGTKDTQDRPTMAGKGC